MADPVAHDESLAPAHDVAAAPGISQLNMHLEKAFGAVFDQIAEVTNNLNILPDMKVAIDEILGSIQQGAANPAPMRTRIVVPGIKNDRVRPLEEEIKKLKGENASLITLKTTLERDSAKLRTELQKLNKKNLQLHQLFHNNHKDEDFSEEDASKKFTEIYHNTRRLVAAHFSRNAALNKNANVTIVQPSDFVFFVQSTIADRLHTKFFNDRLSLFGLGGSWEVDAVELEKRMEQKAVPAADVLEWRIALIKAARKMDATRADKYARDVAREIFDEILRITVVSDLKTAGKELEELCVETWQTALLLRTSRTAYEWHQNRTASEIPTDDRELVGPYNVYTETDSSRPVKVLFGPLYKVVDGERVLLRPGDVLNGQ